MVIQLNYGVQKINTTSVDKGENIMATNQRKRDGSCGNGPKRDGSGPYRDGKGVGPRTGGAGRGQKRGGGNRSGGTGRGRR